VEVVPGAVDWSVDEGAVDVSAGGELAEPAGDVDSCLEQADMSARALTHNNRTLRFIKSPLCCNGTVTQRALILRGPGTRYSRKRRSGQPRGVATQQLQVAFPVAPTLGGATLQNWYSSFFPAGARA